MSATPKPPITESLVALAVGPNVCDEKCLVSQYRTTAAQKTQFEQLLRTNTKTQVPIEWVIDIADESNGWFYGTAYHFDDTTQMLHVMVPDKQNPSFDGQVLLDHRTVHLIECVDGKSDALFNKIVRESIVKVKWDVEWFEEENPGHDDGVEARGSWVASQARYYIRIANQVLVEDNESEDGTKGYVMLTADLNLRLLRCQRGKGLEDFNRLVLEAVVQSTPEALEAAQSSVPAIPLWEKGGVTCVTPGGTMAHSAVKHKAPVHTGGTITDDRTAEDTPTGAAVSIRKLADISRNLRECVSDLLDDREAAADDLVGLAKAIKDFTMDGDLDAGLRLLEQADVIVAKKAKATAASKGDENEDPMDATASDAWHFAQKMEKGIVRLLKSGGDVASNASDELEQLRKMQKKMKKELDERDKELQQLRGKN
jgi:hypothetical protein